MEHGDDRPRRGSVSTGKHKGEEGVRYAGRWEGKGTRSRDERGGGESDEEHREETAGSRRHRREQDRGLRRAFEEKEEGRQRQRKSPSLDYFRRSEQEDREGRTDRREKGAVKKSEGGEGRRPETDESWWRRREHDEGRGDVGYRAVGRRRSRDLYDFHADDRRRRRDEYSSGRGRDGTEKDYPKRHYRAGPYEGSRRETWEDTGRRYRAEGGGEFARRGRDYQENPRHHRGPWKRQAGNRERRRSSSFDSRDGATESVERGRATVGSRLRDREERTSARRHHGSRGRGRAPSDSGGTSQDGGERGICGSKGGSGTQMHERRSEQMERKRHKVDTKEGPSPAVESRIADAGPGTETGSHDREKDNSDRSSEGIFPIRCDRKGDDKLLVTAVSEEKAEACIECEGECRVGRAAETACADTEEGHLEREGGSNGRAGRASRWDVSVPHATKMNERGTGGQYAEEPEQADFLGAERATENNGRQGEKSVADVRERQHREEGRKEISVRGGNGKAEEKGIMEVRGRVERRSEEMEVTNAAWGSGGAPEQPRREKGGEGWGKEEDVQNNDAYRLGQQTQELDDSKKTERAAQEHSRRRGHVQGRQVESGEGDGSAAVSGLEADVPGSSPCCDVPPRSLAPSSLPAGDFCSSVSSSFKSSVSSPLSSSAVAPSQPSSDLGIASFSQSSLSSSPTSVVFSSLAHSHPHESGGEPEPPLSHSVGATTPGLGTSSASTVVDESLTCGGRSLSSRSYARVTAASWFSGSETVSQGGDPVDGLSGKDWARGSESRSQSAEMDTSEHDLDSPRSGKGGESPRLLKQVPLPVSLSPRTSSSYTPASPSASQPPFPTASSPRLLASFQCSSFSSFRGCASGTSFRTSPDRAAPGSLSRRPPSVPPPPPPPPPRPIVLAVPKVSLGTSVTDSRGNVLPLSFPPTSRAIASPCEAMLGASQSITPFGGQAHNSPATSVLGNRLGQDSPTVWSSCLSPSSGIRTVSSNVVPPPPTSPHRKPSPRPVPPPPTESSVELPRRRRLWDVGPDDVRVVLPRDPRLSRRTGAPCDLSQPTGKSDTSGLDAHGRKKGETDADPQDPSRAMAGESGEKTLTHATSSSLENRTRATASSPSGLPLPSGGNSGGDEVGDSSVAEKRDTEAQSEQASSRDAFYGVEGHGRHVRETKGFLKGLSAQRPDSGLESCTQEDRQSLKTHTPSSLLQSAKNSDKVYPESAGLTDSSKAGGSLFTPKLLPDRDVCEGSPGEEKKLERRGDAKVTSLKPHCGGASTEKGSTPVFSREQLLGGVSIKRHRRLPSSVKAPANAGVGPSATASKGATEKQVSAPIVSCAVRATGGLVSASRETADASPEAPAKINTVAQAQSTEGTANGRVGRNMCCHKLFFCGGLVRRTPGGGESSAALQSVGRDSSCMELSTPPPGRAAGDASTSLVHPEAEDAGDTLLELTTGSEGRGGMSVGRRGRGVTTERGLLEAQAASGKTVKRGPGAVVFHRNRGCRDEKKMKRDPQVAVFLQQLQTRHTVQGGDGGEGAESLSEDTITSTATEEGGDSSEDDGFSFPHTREEFDRDRAVVPSWPSAHRESGLGVRGQEEVAVEKPGKVASGEKAGPPCAHTRKARSGTSSERKLLKAAAEGEDTTTSADAFDENRQAAGSGSVTSASDWSWSSSSDDEGLPASSRRHSQKAESSRGGPLSGLSSLDAQIHLLFRAAARAAIELEVAQKCADREHAADHEAARSKLSFSTSSFRISGQISEDMSSSHDQRHSSTCSSIPCVTSSSALVCNRLRGGNVRMPVPMDFSSRGSGSPPPDLYSLLRARPFGSITLARLRGAVWQVRALRKRAEASEAAAASAVATSVGELTSYLLQPNKSFCADAAPEKMPRATREGEAVGFTPTDSGEHLEGHDSIQGRDAKHKKTSLEERSRFKTGDTTSSDPKRSHEEGGLRFGSRGTCAEFKSAAAALLHEMPAVREVLRKVGSRCGKVIKSERRRVHDEQEEDGGMGREQRHTGRAGRGERELGQGREKERKGGLNAKEDLTSRGDGCNACNAKLGTDGGAGEPIDIGGFGSNTPSQQLFLQGSETPPSQLRARKKEEGSTTGSYVHRQRRHVDAKPFAYDLRVGGGSCIDLASEAGRLSSRKLSEVTSASHPTKMACGDASDRKPWEGGSRDDFQVSADSVSLDRDLLKKSCEWLDENDSSDADSDASGEVGHPGGFLFDDPFATVDAGCSGVFLPTHTLELNPGDGAGLAGRTSVTSLAYMSKLPLAAVGTTDGAVTLFDVSRPQAAHHLSSSSSRSLRDGREVKGEVKCVSWHEEAECLGSGREAGQVEILDPRVRGGIAMSWRAHRGPTEKLQFIGHNVCATSSSMEMYVRFWDLRVPPPSHARKSSFLASSEAWDGHLLRAVKADSGICAFAVSPGSGELLALATLCGEVQLMTSPTSVEPFEQILAFPSVNELDCFSSLIFSQNGRALLVQGERQHSDRMRDATRLLSYPFCEVWDLQDSRRRSKMQSFAAFWPHLRRYPDLFPISALGNEREPGCTSSFTWGHASPSPCSSSSCSGSAARSASSRSSSFEASFFPCASGSVPTSPRSLISADPSECFSSSAASLSPLFELPLCFFPACVAVSVEDNLLPFPAASGITSCNLDPYSLESIISTVSSESSSRLARDSDGFGRSQRPQQSEDGQDISDEAQDLGAGINGLGSGKREAMMDGPGYLLYLNTSFSRFCQSTLRSARPSTPRGAWRSASCESSGNRSETPTRGSAFIVSASPSQQSVSEERLSALVPTDTVAPPLGTRREIARDGAEPAAGPAGLGSPGSLRESGRQHRNADPQIGQPTRTAHKMQASGDLSGGTDRLSRGENSASPLLPQQPPASNAAPPNTCFATHEQAGKNLQEQEDSPPRDAVECGGLSGISVVATPSRYATVPLQSSSLALPRTRAVVDDEGGDSATAVVEEVVTRKNLPEKPGIVENPVDLQDERLELRCSSDVSVNSRQPMATCGEKRTALSTIAHADSLGGEVAPRLVGGGETRPPSITVSKGREKHLAGTTKLKGQDGSVAAYGSSSGGSLRGRSRAHWHPTRTVLSHTGRRYTKEEDLLYSWTRRAARVCRGPLGGDSQWPARRFVCSFWRDKVVGVGGPLHLAGAMKLWDATTGFMDSCSISSSSQDMLTCVAAHPRGGPLVLSGGERTSTGSACVTLWGYFTVDQIDAFGMV